MTAQNPPIFLQAGSHPAEDVRRALGGLQQFTRPAIMGSTDLAVSQNGTPNMSVNVADGRAAIPGTEATYQGTYFVENRGTTNLAIAAADATNPRRDLIVAKVQDAAYSGATNAWSLAVATGVPAASPVDPATPANAMLLAHVQVDAGVTSIVTAKITDLRSSTTQGLYTAKGGTAICTSTTRPASPVEGVSIYETDTDRTLVYNGSAWVIEGDSGGWSSWTPTVTGITNLTLTGRYRRLGRAVFIQASGTASGTIGGAGDMSFALPVASHGDIIQAINGGLAVAGGSRYVTSGRIAAGASVVTPIHAGTANYIAAGSPAAMPSGSIFTFGGWYEAAASS